MSPDLEKILQSRYPSLYQELRGDPRTTGMSFGFEVGDGWFELINAASAIIAERGDAVVAHAHGAEGVDLTDDGEAGGAGAGEEAAVGGGILEGEGRFIGAGVGGGEQRLELGIGSEGGGSRQRGRNRCGGLRRSGGRWGS